MIPHWFVVCGVFEVRRSCEGKREVVTVVRGSNQEKFPSK